VSLPNKSNFRGQDHEDKPTGPHEQPVLRLIISDYRWVANCGMGTFWHEANDMDDKDIASFALSCPTGEVASFISTSTMSASCAKSGDYSLVWHAV
jgi:hypothetical protein